MKKPDRKHYYNELGILDFEQNTSLLIKLAKTLDLKDFHCKEGRRAMRQLIIEKAVEVLYDYKCYEGFGESAAGGSLKFTEWVKREEDDPTSQVLKLMLLDVVERGYMEEEFMLIAWSAACDMQIFYITN